MKLIRQTEMSECGLACVAMVASNWGLDLDMPYLRRRFSISQRGATINTLMVVASKLGLSARPLKVPLDELEYLQLPAILHWDLNHYGSLSSWHRLKISSSLNRHRNYDFPSCGMGFPGSGGRYYKSRS